MINRALVLALLTGFLSSWVRKNDVLQDLVWVQ